MFMRRTRCAAVSVLLGTLLLAGCARSSDRHPADRSDRHELVKKEIEELYSRTIPLVGDQWENIEQEWEQCGRSDLRRDNEQWAKDAYWTTPIHQDPRALAEKVAS